MFIFLLELAVAVLAFLFQDWVRDKVKEFFEINIKSYRDDIDLQNLIDSLQKIVSLYPVTSFTHCRKLAIWTFSFVVDLPYSVANSAVLQIFCLVAAVWGVSGRQDVLRYSAVLTASVEAALPSIHLPLTSSTGSPVLISVAPVLSGSEPQRLFILEELCYGASSLCSL